VDKVSFAPEGREASDALLAQDQAVIEARLAILNEAIEAGRKAIAEELIAPSQRSEEDRLLDRVQMLEALLRRVGVAVPE